MRDSIQNPEAVFFVRVHCVALQGVCFPELFIALDALFCVLSDVLREICRYLQGGIKSHSHLWAEEDEWSSGGDIPPQAAGQQTKLSPDCIINKVLIAQITRHWESAKKCRSHTTIRNSIPEASCSFESNQFLAKFHGGRRKFLFIFTSHKNSFCF